MQEIQAKLKDIAGKTLDFLVRYRTIVISAALLAVFGTTIFRVGMLVDPPADLDLYNEKVNQLVKIKFDEKAIERIEALRDAEVTVDPNLNTGRTNPFQDR